MFHAILPFMSTLAEIEQAVETLTPAERNALLRFLAARSEVRLPSSLPYRTRTHPGGVQPGIDPDKLGQLPEDF